MVGKISGLVTREAETKLLQWLKQDYLVALLGARQTGKTTLLHKIAASQESYYYSFDDLLFKNKVADDFYFLQNDLENRLGTTLEKLNRPILVLLDEAQKEPTVFDLLKIWQDRFASKMKIIISGSASLEIQKKTSESLAGRAQYVYLHPFSLGEILRFSFGFKDESLFLLLGEKEITFDFFRQRQALLYPKQPELKLILEQILLYGLLPGVWSRKSEERLAYLRSIVTLYLEKDIRLAGLVRELDNFQNFLEVLAYQVGGLLNLTHCSNQIQVSTNTLRAYRTILKETFVLNLLPPFVFTPQKRVVKNTKAYFYDVGVANFLAKRERLENVFDSRAGGGIFENILVKSYEAFGQNQTLAPRLFFWRDYHQAEIDLIIQKGDQIVPVEITGAAQIERRKIHQLGRFLEVQKKASYSLIIYNGEVKELKTKPKPIYALPWWLWW